MNCLCKRIAAREQTNQARPRAINIAGNRYRFRVLGLLMGFCWNSDSLRVRVDSKLNHCIRTRLKKSVNSTNKMRRDGFLTRNSRAYILIALYSWARWPESDRRHSHHTWAKALKMEHHFAGIQSRMLCKPNLRVCTIMRTSKTMLTLSLQLDSRWFPRKNMPGRGVFRLLDDPSCDLLAFAVGDQLQAAHVQGTMPEEHQWPHR